MAKVVKSKVKAKIIGKAGKQLVVDEIADKLKQAKGVVLTDFRGLDVHALGDLRKKLIEQGIEYRVVKNTLIERAVDKCELAEVKEHLTGPTALAFDYNDSISIAKILVNFEKTNDFFNVKAGVIEGRILNKDEVKKVASIPSREQLIANLLCGMQSPISGLANVLSASIRGLAIALKAVADQRQA
ncbi:MAG: 50S ribosomal protein L10 [Actinobacteria bacterium]|nr:50S ribosomal protein L10 [Actinomycetota bacterium]